jgi:hypothetical protein
MGSLMDHTRISKFRRTWSRLVFGSSLLVFGIAPALAPVQNLNPVPGMDQISLDAPDEYQPAGQPAYKISVEADGIYHLTYAALHAAGIPVNSLDPRTFKLENHGVEIAMYALGQGDGVFNPGDYLLFYAQKTDTKYTDENTYWLSWGGAFGKRMLEVDSAPSSAPIPAEFLTSVHLEEDHTYQSARPSGNGKDKWYWNGLQVKSPNPSAALSFSTTLSNLAVGSPDASVRGLLKGHADYPQHHVKIYLNDHLVIENTFPTGSEYFFDVSVPHSWLLEGANAIKVELLRDNNVSRDVIFINWFEIDYYDTYIAENDILLFDGDSPGSWRFELDGFSTDQIYIFDITDPSEPQRLVNGAISSDQGIYTISVQKSQAGERHYQAIVSAQFGTPTSILADNPSDLHSQTNGADWIAITHADFYDDILPLASFRQSQGQRTFVVDVQDVYDEFNSGVMDPAAIHDFLAFAYANWSPPAPQFVVLVGDGHYDPKDNLGYGEPVYIPPYLADVDPWLVETGSDNRYVTLVGNDRLPDMHIGRLPVKTQAEISAMVNRIITYEQNPPQGGWNANVLFVADALDPAAGDFAALSDDVADNYLPQPPYIAEKIYYETGSFTNADSTRQEVINAVNSGRLLVSYVGHASVQWWGNSGEQLWNTAAIAALTNSDRLSFFVPMTCMDGYFIKPSAPGSDDSALGEMIVRSVNSGSGLNTGAVASWSPAGLGIASGHDYLEKGLFLALFYNDISQLGPATTYAKQYLYNNTSLYHDLIDTYILFGDPATKLQVVPDPTGVALQDFSATPLNSQAIALAWQTLNEVNLLGFNLYRSAGTDGTREKINPSLIPSQAPGSLTGSTYEFLDGAITPGVEYTYWLEAVAVDGGLTRHDPVKTVWTYHTYLPAVARR